VECGSHASNTGNRALEHSSRSQEMTSRVDAMRGRMNDAKNYAQPQALNETMIGGTVGEVLESRNPGFVAGYGALAIQDLREMAAAT
jgi:NADPH-dependent curcumin reductase CurA